MIGVQLLGGLGNQMFQYAFARALAQRGRTVALDAARLKRVQYGETQRKLEVTSLNVAIPVVGDREFAFYRACAHKLIGRKAQSLLGIYCERSAEYAPDASANSSARYFVGYWQSYRYFDGIRTELLREFAPRTALSTRAGAVAARVLSRRSAAVHVRRGDYVTNRAASQLHGALDEGYYLRAMSELSANVPGVEFFVFSDDIEWCRAKLTVKDPVHFVDGAGDNGTVEDLHLMTLCDHHVIANSSYSWWGAWLARGSSQVVVAPKRWFAGRPPGEARDRIPGSWRTRD